MSRKRQKTKNKGHPQIDSQMTAKWRFGFFTIWQYSIEEILFFLDVRIYKEEFIFAALVCINSSIKTWNFHLKILNKCNATISETINLKNFKWILNLIIENYIWKFCENFFFNWSWMNEYIHIYEKWSGKEKAIDSWQRGEERKKCSIEFKYHNKKK